MEEAYNCPVCGSAASPASGVQPLELEMQAHVGQYWVCKHCGGMLCGLSVLRKLTDAATMRTLWGEALAAPTGDRNCPVCGQAMSRVVSDRAESGKLPTVDICRPCQFIWLDAMELDSLPENPELNAPAEPDKPASMKAREALARAELDSVIRRQRAEDAADGYAARTGWEAVAHFLIRLLR